MSLYFHNIFDGVYYPGEHDVVVLETAPPTSDTTAPATPATATPAAGNGQVSLNWADNTDPDFYQYRIFQATVNGGPYTEIGTSFTSDFTATGLTNGTAYYFVTTAVDIAGNQSANSTQVSATPATATAPAAPTSLVATAGDAEVALNWADNGEGDLDYYRVYQGTVTGGPYTLVGSPTASAYTATGLTNATEYFFVVTAVDTTNNESAVSNEDSDTPTGAAPDVTAPATPTSLSATAGAGQIVLDWADNGEGDLDHYGVYRSTSSGGTYTLITSPTGSAYTDFAVTVGTPYWYKVTAVDESGNESAQTSNATATATGSAAGVNIPCGASIQTYVNANPAGTVFALAACTYSNQAVTPKQGNVFIGALGAGGQRLSILDGGNSTPVAFGPGGSGVTIRNVVVMRYNDPVTAGYGGIKTNTNWIIDNVEIKECAYNGIYFEAGTQCRNSYLHHNGRYGAGGFKANNHIFENNEVSYNNTKNLAGADEGGGKWVGAVNLTFRGNNFHHNFGHGIWIDADALNALLENNISSDNEGYGIHYEINCQGTIRGNTCDRNGNAGIFINASQNVDCYNNTVRDNGHGIRVWAQSNRGSGDNCTWQIGNIDVYDNFIRMSTGFTGMERDNSQSAAIYSSGEVRFENNDYDVPTTGGNWFQWDDGLRNWTYWQAEGHDTTGSIV